MHVIHIYITHMRWAHVCYVQRGCRLEEFKIQTQSEWGDIQAYYQQDKIPALATQDYINIKPRFIDGQSTIEFMFFKNVIS